MPRLTGTFDENVLLPNALAQTDESLPDYDPRGTFSKSFDRGTDNMHAMLYGAANAIARATGVDALSEVGLEGLRNNLQAAAYSPPEVEKWEDIGGLADFGTYVLEAIGEQTPQLLTDLGLAATGAGVGALAVRGALGEGASQLSKAAIGKAFREVIGEKGFREAARRRAAKIGGLGTVGASAFLQNSGETQANLLSRGIDAPYTAISAGIIKSALDLIAPAKLLRVGPGKMMGADEISMLGSRVVGEMVRTGGIESVTEGAQTFVDFLAVGIEDPDFDLFTEETLSELTNAMAKGAIVGGALGGATRGLQNLAEGDDSTPGQLPFENSYMRYRETIGAQLQQAGDQLASFLDTSDPTGALTDQRPPGPAQAGQGARATEPEARSTIFAQIDAMLDPSSTKDSVFLDPQTQVDPGELPDSVARIQTPAGTILTTNPGKARYVEENADNLSEQTIGAILFGKLNGKENIDGTVVVAENAAGAPVAEIATAASDLEGDIALARGQAPDGGRVRITDAQSVLAARAAARDAEPAAPATEPTRVSLADDRALEQNQPLEAAGPAQPPAPEILSDQVRAGLEGLQPAAREQILAAISDPANPQRQELITALEQRAAAAPRPDPRLDEGRPDDLLTDNEQADATLELGLSQADTERFEGVGETVVEFDNPKGKNKPKVRSFATAKLAQIKADSVRAKNPGIRFSVKSNPNGTFGVVESTPNGVAVTGTRKLGYASRLEAVQALNDANKAGRSLDSPTRLPRNSQRNVTLEGNRFFVREVALGDQLSPDTRNEGGTSETDLIRDGILQAKTAGEKRLALQEQNPSPRVADSMTTVTKADGTEATFSTQELTNTGRRVLAQRQAVDTLSATEYALEGYLTMVGELAKAGYDVTDALKPQKQIRTGNLRNGSGEFLSLDRASATRVRNQSPRALGKVENSGSDIVEAGDDIRVPELTAKIEQLDVELAQVQGQAEEADAALEAFDDATPLELLAGDPALNKQRRDLVVKAKAAEQRQKNATNRLAEATDELQRVQTKSELDNENTAQTADEAFNESLKDKVTTEGIDQGRNDELARIRGNERVDARQEYLAGRSPAERRLDEQRFKAVNIRGRIRAREAQEVTSAEERRVRAKDLAQLRAELKEAVDAGVAMKAKLDARRTPAGPAPTTFAGKVKAYGTSFIDTTEVDFIGGILEELGLDSFNEISLVDSSALENMAANGVLTPEHVLQIRDAFVGNAKLLGTVVTRPKSAVIVVRNMRKNAGEKSRHDRLMTIAHEVGHIVMRAGWHRATAVQKEAMRKAYQQDRAFYERAVGRNDTHAFQEWFADRVAARARKLASEKPATGPADSVFKSSAKRLQRYFRLMVRKLKGGLTRRNYGNEAFDQAMRKWKDASVFEGATRLTVHEVIDQMSLDDAQGSIKDFLGQPRIASARKAVTDWWNGSGLRKGLVVSLFTVDGRIREIDSQIADMLYSETNTRSRVSYDQERKALRARWIGKLQQTVRKHDYTGAGAERTLKDIAQREFEAAQAYRELAKELPTEDLSPLAKSIRQVMEDMYVELKKAMPTLGKIDNYFPHNWNHFELEQRRDEAIALLKKHGVKEAESTLARISSLADQGVLRDDVFVPLRQGFQRSREVFRDTNPAMIDALVEGGFLNADPINSLRTYIDAATRRAAVEKLFGGHQRVPRSFVTGAIARHGLEDQQQAIDFGYLRQRNGEFEWWMPTHKLDAAILSRVPLDKQPEVRRLVRQSISPILGNPIPRGLRINAQVFSRKNTPLQREAAKMIARQEDGTPMQLDAVDLANLSDPAFQTALVQVRAKLDQPFTRDSAVYKGIEHIRAYESLRTLMFSGIASVPEVAGVFARNKGTLSNREMTKELWSTMRNWKDVRTFAEDLGIVTHEIGDVARTELVHNANVGGPLNKAVNAMFHYNGNEFIVNMSRTYAAIIGRRFLIRNVLDLQQDPNNARAKRYLKELNVKPETVMRWADPDGIGGSFDSAAFNAADAKVIDEVTRAINRFVNEGTLNPSPSERPGYASHPLGMLVFHLKTFMYSFSKNILGGMAREFKQRTAEGESIKQGYIDAAMYLGSAAAIFLMFGLLSDELRERVKSLGARGSLEAAYYDPERWINKVIDRSGLTAIPYFDAVLNPSWNNTVFAAGPTISHADQLMGLMFEGEFTKATLTSIPGLSQLPALRRIIEGA